MKFIFALVFASAAVLPAATIQCTPGNLNLVTNTVNNSPQAESCGTINATPGFVIDTIQLGLIGSFQDAMQGTNHQLTFTGTTNVNGATVTGNTGIGDFIGTTNFITGSAVALPGLATLGLVTFTGSAATVDGNPLPDNASFTGFIITTERPATVPEPTMSLMSAAFLGLAVFGHRVMKKRNLS